MAMHRVLVPHKPRDGDKPAGALGWWIWTHPCDQEGFGPFVLIECPYGHVGTLRHLHNGRGHKIGNDGAVSPSVVCAQKHCTFHAYVVLETWQPILTA